LPGGRRQPKCGLKCGAIEDHYYFSIVIQWLDNKSGGVGGI
jgi:hypothetical protein